MLVRFNYVFSNAILMDCAVKYADAQRRVIDWISVQSGDTAINPDIEISQGRTLFDLLAEEALNHA